MTGRTRRNVSPETRAACAARLAALNADPAVKAKQIASRSRPWSAERRARYELKMATALPRPRKIPEHAHPCVRGFFAALNNERAALSDIAGRTGIGCDTLRFMNTRHMPRLDTIDAALCALDLELAIVPRGTRDQNGFPKKKNGNAKTGAEE